MKTTTWRTTKWGATSGRSTGRRWSSRERGETNPVLINDVNIVVECEKGGSAGNREVGRINLAELPVVLVGHVQDCQEAEGRRYLFLFVVAVEYAFEGGPFVDLLLYPLFRLYYRYVLPPHVHFLPNCKVVIKIVLFFCVLPQEGGVLLAESVAGYMSKWLNILFAIRNLSSIYSWCYCLSGSGLNTASLCSYYPKLN